MRSLACSSSPWHRPPRPRLVELFPSGALVSVILHYPGCQCTIRPRAIGVLRILKDRLPRQRRLGEANRVGDAEVIHLVAVLLLDRSEHLLRMQRTRLVERGEDADELEARVEPALHALHRDQELL